MESKLLKELMKQYDLKEGMNLEFEEIRSIARKENIKMEDLLKLLGICRVEECIDFEKIKKARNLKVNFYLSEELEKIKEIIKELYDTKELITKKQVEILEKKYFLDFTVIQKILNLKKVEKDTFGIEKEEKMNYTQRKIREKIKYLDILNKMQIEEILQENEINEKELISLLKISSFSYHSLKKGKTKTIRIDLLEAKEKRELENKIIEKCKGKDFITKEELQEIQTDKRMTNKIIKDALSITDHSFHNLNYGIVKKTRIVIREIKRKAFMVQMDWFYYKNQCFHTKQELKRKSKKLNITYEELVKNITGKINRFTYNLWALDNNKKGIYIGEEIPISNNFLEKNEKKLRQIAKKETFKWNKFYDYEKDEIEEKVFLDLIMTGGSLEKNFSFDEELLFILMTAKAKQRVWGECTKLKKEGIYRRKYSAEIEENPFVKEQENYSKIKQAIHKKEHKQIIDQIEKEEENIFIDRNYGLEKVAQSLKIPKKILLQELEEIHEILLQTGVVKRGKNGKIILSEQ